MRKLMGYKLFLLAVLGATLLTAATAFAQAKCEVKIRIFEFKEDGSAENFPVTDANISISRESPDGPITPQMIEGSLVATLTSGFEYMIEIGKPGFMTTKDSVECHADESAEPVSPIFFIWAGDPKEVKQPLPVKPIKSEGSVDIVSGGSVDLIRTRMKKGEMVAESQARTVTPTDVTPIEISDQTIATSSKSISGGVVNGKAAQLVRPAYPAVAKAVRASGEVDVLVKIDELGHVISAKAISGHPLLRAAAVKAARESKFRMTVLGGYPVQVTGIIIYNFQP